MLRIKALFLTLGSLLAISAVGQVIEPVKWSYKIVDEGEGIYDFQATAAMDEGWHVYANVIGENLPPDFIGPFPTEFLFPDTNSYELVGAIRELGDQITHYDPQFDADLNYFEGSATWAQRVKRTSDSVDQLDFQLSYQACDETMCIFPPPVDLRISWNADGTASAAEGPFSLDSEDTGGEGLGLVNPVEWSFSSIQLDNGNYALSLTATVDEGWHIYSQFLDSDEGPLPTVFTFAYPEGVSAVGAVTEPEAEEHYDPNFLMDVRYHEGSVTFVQEVQSEGTPTIAGEVEYMICNDEGCFPDGVKFAFDLESGSGAEVAPEGEATGDDNPYKLDSVDLENPLSDCGQEKEERSLWLTFLLGFGGGLFALFTPCVFPMIPLTVSFFTKGSEERGKGIFRAITYGFFIFLIYLSLSAPFHIWDLPPEVLNQISTSASLNIFFFVIFVVFAISFFGYFEITLPSSWTNKADAASSKKTGIIGIFFMALTLALVSFSCTGPLLGSVLGQSLSKGPWPISAGMAGFGIALGLPFAIFAMFPGLMNALPKSGGWLNSVKVVLGFVELALAIKFLSNADLVYKLHIIERETFFLLWTLIAILTAMYLFGWIKFPHDSPKVKWSPARIGFTALFVGFAIYLFPGVLKNPTWDHNLLSGLPPAKTYSWYDWGTDCPLALDCEHDFFEGQEMALSKDKPIFIDFTGHACVNCRKMEDNVWSEEPIYKILSEEVQVVSLYVDEKKERHDGMVEVIEVEYQGGRKKKREIKTVGDRWSALEIMTFQNSTQPLYVMLTPDGRLLSPPKAYTPDVEEYREWLQCGLDAYKSEKLQAEIKN